MYFESWDPIGQLYDQLGIGGGVENFGTISKFVWGENLFRSQVSTSIPFHGVLVKVKFENKGLETQKPPSY